MAEEGEDTYKCPKCGSQESVWRGYRYNQSGKKRLRKCKNCGSKFSPDDGFLRRRFQKEHIVEAVSLYQSGLSLSKVKDHMWQHHGVKVSRWMILLWCQYFSNVIRDYTEMLKPEIKGNVHADEVIVKSKGKNNYYWGAKDRKTKFKIAGILTEHRTLSGAKHVFEKQTESNRPKARRYTITENLSPSIENRRSEDTIPNKYALLLLILLTVALVVSASMQKRSVEYLTGEADVIIIGNIKEVESRWNFWRTEVHTYSTVSVEKYIKGTGSETLTIITDGGTVGDLEGHMMQ